MFAKLQKKMSVQLEEKLSVELEEEPSVDLKEKTSAELMEKASVELKDKAPTELKEKTSVDLKDKAPTELKEKTSVDLKDKASTELKEKTSVDLKDKASTQLKEKTSVDTRETSVAAKEKTPAVRLVFLGAAGVGKTALIQRFLQDTFEPEHLRTVEELHRRPYRVGGATVTVEILDTSGSYSFPAMRRLSIQHSDAFALVYAVDDPESLEAVKRLQAEIVAVTRDRFPPIVVVGNKSDRRGERRVSAADALATAELNWNHSVLEASAKDDANVAEVFRELLQHARLGAGRLSPALQQRRRQTFPTGASDHPPIKNTNICSVS